MSWKSRGETRSIKLLYNVDCLPDYTALTHKKQYCN